jgi:hypothetical protein
MSEQQNQPQQMTKVPARAEHRIKVIIAKYDKDLEKETNEFLETISDERLLKGIVFATNQKTGEMIHIINYTNLFPMSAEEWAIKQEKQKKFAKGFVPNDLMPNGAKVSKL